MQTVQTSSKQNELNLKDKWGQDLKNSYQEALTNRKDNNWSHNLATEYLKSLSKLSQKEGRDYLLVEHIPAEVTQTKDGKQIEYPEQFKITEWDRLGRHHIDRSVFIRIKNSTSIDGEVKDQGGLEYSLKRISVEKNLGSETSSTGKSYRENRSSAKGYMMASRQDIVADNVLSILNLGLKPHIDQKEISDTMNAALKSTNYADGRFKLEQFKVIGIENDKNKSTTTSETDSALKEVTLPKLGKSQAN